MNDYLRELLNTDRANVLLYSFEEWLEKVACTCIRDKIDDNKYLFEKQFLSVLDIKEEIILLDTQLLELRTKSKFIVRIVRRISA
jgi:hypothetical protein